MRITAVPHPELSTVLLPGNKHRTDPRDPLDVVAADRYRTAMTVLVPAARSAGRTALEQNLRDDDRRPGEPYGLILRESQVHYLTVLTDAETLLAYRAGQVPLPAGPHVRLYPGWAAPGDETWYQLLPPTTWFPGDGAGVLAEYEGVGGATVTLFEYGTDRGRAFNPYGRRAHERVSMVSWHCDRCHRPAVTDHDARWMNLGPADRQYADRHARAHALGMDEKCTPPPSFTELAIIDDATSSAALCAASGGCSQVRLARVVTAQLMEQTQGRGDNRAY